MKLFYFKDGKKPLNYFETEEQIIVPNEYKEKSVRAVWVSVVENIDLPVLTDEKAYKKELDTIVANCVKYNLNTIYFQVRPLNDAFYKSKLNPYSRYLTGKEGLAPSFDVLKYIIEKAKKHNIEVHAWANPYRVSRALGELTKEEYLNTLDDINFAKLHPELTITDSNNMLILNPTSEEVKQFIIDSMVEILENYDVKGIHWDDYFYPYAPLSDHDNDLPNFEKRENKELTLEEFRRFHVTDVIRRTHLAVKGVNQNLQFGVSPFGIWRSIHTDPRGANISKNTSESYRNQYADTYEWVKNEYIDYIVPQLYWEFGHHLAPFGDLAKWWADVVRGTNVKLYIGHASYRLGREGEFENPEEVSNQLRFVNAMDEVDGNVFFTYKNFNGIEADPKGMESIRKTLNNEK